MPITNPALAQQISDLVSYWKLRDTEYAEWVAGSATGGPYGDGRYPLTNYLNQTVYVKCPAALQAAVLGTVDSAAGFADDAAAALSAALAAQTAAENAVATANSAATSASAAASTAVNAQTYAQAAEASAQSALATVNGLVDSLTLGNIPYKNQNETITGTWSFGARPTVGGINVVLANEVPSLDGVVLSTRVVGTSGSLTGGGALGANLTLALVNDLAAPGNSMVYATDATGAKGWFAGVFPARSIATQHSLQGGGNLGADRTISLVGDVATPGALKVYGTDAAGNRGWRDTPTPFEGVNPGSNTTYGTNASGVKGFFARPLVMRGAAFVSSSALTTTVAPVSVFFPRGATIKRIVLIGDATGSVTVEIRKSTLAGAAGGTGGTPITGGDLPAISGATSSDKTDFTGWVTSVGSGECLNFSIASVSTFKRVTIQVFLEENL